MIATKRMNVERAATAGAFSVQAWTLLDIQAHATTSTATATDIADFGNYVSVTAGEPLVVRNPKYA